MRGLHFQIQSPQAKLCQVLQGEVFDVAVDLRKDSTTYGQWVSALLSSENRHQLYIPAGFAHGFQVISETALFHYKCSDIYRPGDEGGLRWDDPSLKIDWPHTDPILSLKDAQYKFLNT